MDDHSTRDDLITYYKKAYQQSKAHEYDYTFFECRKSGELFLRTLANRKDIALDQRERQIEKMIGAFKGSLPRVVEASIRLIQSIGNYGSHHQESKDQETDRLFTEPCLAATRSLIKYLYNDVDFHQIDAKIDEEYSSNVDALPKSMKKREPVRLAAGASLRVKLRQYVENHYSMNDVFRLGDLSRAFHKQHLEEYTHNSVYTHACFMTTNYPSRLQHRIKVDGSDDLLFRVDKGIYRRFNRETDPIPTYPESRT